VYTTNSYLLRMNHQGTHRN